MEADRVEYRGVTPRFMCQKSQSNPGFRASSTHSSPGMNRLLSRRGNGVQLISIGRNAHGGRWEAGAGAKMLDQQEGKFRAGRMMPTSEKE
jgi:hypothetical protein